MMLTGCCKPTTTVSYTAANASGVTLSSDVGSWTQTCLLHLQALVENVACIYIVFVFTLPPVEQQCNECVCLSVHLHINLWRKNMRYAHFDEICERCGTMRNMQQLHICIKLTCLTCILTWSYCVISIIVFDLIWFLIFSLLLATSRSQSGSINISVILLNVVFVFIFGDYGAAGFSGI